MKIVKTIKERWVSETPKFFKGIKRIAVTLGSSATTVWVTNDSMSLELDSSILEICKYIIAASAAMGITAQLTQVNSQDDELVK